MNCIHVTVVFLALTACRQEARPRRLEGLWVGTLELGGEMKFIRAEFAGARWGFAGALHVLGASDLTLVRASESDGRVFFEMKRGDDRFVFAGELRQGAISGTAYSSREQARFDLRRTREIDRRLLAAYAGAYGDAASIEDCTSELGWPQLIYVDRRSGGRKALFPRTENSFFFGPGYLIPGPVEGTITFLGGATRIVVEQAGEDPEIAQRSLSDLPPNARGCGPLRGKRLTAGRSG